MATTTEKMRTMNMAPKRCIWKALSITRRCIRWWHSHRHHRDKQGSLAATQMSLRYLVMKMICSRMIMHLIRQILRMEKMRTGLMKMSPVRAAAEPVYIKCRIETMKTLTPTSTQLVGATIQNLTQWIMIMKTSRLTLQEAKLQGKLLQMEFKRVTMCHRSFHFKAKFLV